jgi:hypothetical protein
MVSQRRALASSFSANVCVAQETSVAPTVHAQSVSEYGSPEW